MLFRSGAVVGTTVEEQGQQVIANLREVLSAGGATLSDVVSATIYLENEQDWPVVNDLWKSTLSSPYPSRTTVGARRRGILIEISVVAFLPH